MPYSDIMQSPDQDLCGGVQRPVHVPDGRQQEERAVHCQVHRLLPVSV